MTQSVPLDAEKHRQLKLDRTQTLAFFAGQQSIQLQASELVQAASCFPLFLIRDPDTGAWQPTALTGFLPDNNLFVQQGQWLTAYRPGLLEVYPFHLLARDEEGKRALGFDSASPCLSSNQGEALFDANGKPTALTQALEQRLQAYYRDGAFSYHFCQHLERLGLLREIDLLVDFQTASAHQLAGLHTINEEALNTLEQASLAELQQKGYLGPLYALLISLYQVNNLIRAHNGRLTDQPIKRVRIEAKKS